jgi:hypothetical protein
LSRLRRSRGAYWYRYVQRSAGSEGRRASQFQAPLAQGCGSPAGRISVGHSLSRMPPSEPLSCSSAKGIPNPRRADRRSRSLGRSSRGSGALAFVGRALTLGAWAVPHTSRSAVFPTEWWPTAFRIGPKSHRKRWLHPLRKARLANLMRKAYGSKCDTAGIFTAFENRGYVGPAAGAETLLRLA